MAFLAFEQRHLNFVENFDIINIAALVKGDMQLLPEPLAGHYILVPKIFDATIAHVSPIHDCVYIKSTL